MLYKFSESCVLACGSITFDEVDLTTDGAEHSSGETTGLHKTW